MTAMRTLPAMTVESDLSRRLRRAARKIDEATEERDALILEALAAGGSLREVASLVGLTHAGVKDIRRRKGDLPGRPSAGQASGNGGEG